MKTITKGLFKGFSAITVMTMLSAGIATAQNTLQFTGAKATDEQAIRLTWASVSNEVYQIQCANALATNADGSTAWQLLYDGYPSQGTNTFWLDTGNYNLAPQILHPKDMPMRFYRILDEGPDTTSDEPSVSITTPTNGTATGELTITVAAATDQPVLSGTKLYVDGQEMRPADSITNWTDGSTNYEVDTYSINTCEWGNETHSLFATAENLSGYGDVVNGPPVMTGHAVSPFVSVLFSNLITRISFSQPSFDPSSGQTQQVSAVFAANCDWTLTIRDVYSNAVRTVTGSGNSMLFNWDGTGDGETNLPNGIYYYYISAATNGQSGNLESGDSIGDGFSSSLGPEIPELWAVAPNSETVVPLALYPPGFDTNGFTIFSATPSEVEFLTASSASDGFATTTDSGGGFSPADSGGGSSAASQDSAATPQRPPSNPVRGLAGTFGIACDTYTGNGTNGYTVGPIGNGCGLGAYISLNNHSPSDSLGYKPTPSAKDEADQFLAEMQRWGWQNKIYDTDNQLSINDLKYGGSKFNYVNLAVLISHGAYGTGVQGIDCEAGGARQMYFPITSGSGAQYLRMSDMNLGAGLTNGLKWFVFASCDSLHQANWQEMQSHGSAPYNNNLHLVLGANSTNYSSPPLLARWARYMTYGTAINPGFPNPLTIREAWYQAAQDTFQNAQGIPPGTKIIYAVAGDNACFNDMVATNYFPGGSWFYDSKPIYP